MTQRIMILATDGFEQSELEGPKERLEQAGFATLVVSPQGGQITGWKEKDWGRPVAVDLTLDEADAKDFDALLLPGGQMNPDILRMEKRAIALIQEFSATRKPIAAICHAPWLLAEANILAGRKVTGWPSIRTDLKNAGAEVVDEPVVVDEHLITSRQPDDIPAFTDALIAQLKMLAEPA